MQASSSGLRFLVAECEPPEARETRRESVGRSSGETYRDLLVRLAPGAVVDSVKPTDSDGGPMPAGRPADYDAVFLSGSPLALYEDTPETRRAIGFMRAVFASGTPAFGSCAGLQLATVAAGGIVRPNRRGPEAGFARRIVSTEAGRLHPMLSGRPASYDAPSIHTDEVETLPTGAVVLAGNCAIDVQAAEISLDRGVFWGVQYHPEIGLDEVAGALRRQSGDLIACGLARNRGEVEDQAGLIEALHREPERRDLAWRLGLDDQVVANECRQTELRNFIDALRRHGRTLKA